MPVDTVLGLPIKFIATLASHLKHVSKWSLVIPYSKRSCQQWHGFTKSLVTKKGKANLTFKVALSLAGIMVQYLNVSKENGPEPIIPTIRIQEEQTQLVAISPSLDLIRSRLSDAAHPEYAGIVKQAPQSKSHQPLISILHTSLDFKYSTVFRRSNRRFRLQSQDNFHQARAIALKIFLV